MKEECMSRQKVTLESLVSDYFSTYSAPPEFLEDLVSNREDCQEVQVALERAIVPELHADRQRSFQLYDAIRSRLDPVGQMLLSEFWAAQSCVVTDSEHLAWTIGAAVQRHILLTPCPN
jgi:hypothetical protein